jgi:hypothetical protein
MGFGTPDDEMIRGPLRADIKETILDRSFLSTGVVRADRIQELILDFERGGGMGAPIRYRLLNGAIHA